VAASERVALRCVKPCTDEHKVGLVFFGDGAEQLIYHCFVLLISSTRFWPRHVNVVASAVTLAYPVVISLGSPGVEIALVMAVHRKHQDCVVLPKHLLRAVTMMHIPVKN
jgi:hypothetical protein